MNVISIIRLFGGVGLFLFGMSLMGSSLEKLAGSGLEKILETLTTSKKKGVGAIKGWALGTGVTGIIQSSAATTIMLIGFVNAGIMTLSQSIPVVFGANVGSTVTAQILRLGDLGSGTIILQLLKPSSFAPMLITAGAVMFFSKKKRKMRDVAGILIGLGILFYGMTIMEEVFAPLKESETFRNFFTSFENPLVGILTGTILTAIIQSSSASVGILQALSATGSVTYGIAVPIIIGQNIGKCFTIILGGIGANKKAKRVSASYLIFNIIGAVVYSLIIYGIYYTVGIPQFSNVVNRGDIANVHLAFNLIMSIVLLPFSGKVANLTGKMLKDSDATPGDNELQKLDSMLLKTPGIALKQCADVINVMSEKILENFRIATELIHNYDSSVFSKLEENENFVDRCETALSSYIVRIDRKRLTADDKLQVSEILNSIGDFERIGDYCMNIAYVARSINEDKITFSQAGEDELEKMRKAAKYTLQTAITSFAESDGDMAVRVEILSNTINKLKEIIKTNHIERLQDGKCGVEGGAMLFDITNSYERIAAHSANIAMHVVKRVKADSDFDEMHGHMSDMNSEETKALQEYYSGKYIDPIISYNDNSDEENVPPVEKSSKKSGAKKKKKKKEKE